MLCQPLLKTKAIAAVRFMEKGHQQSLESPLTTAIL